LRIWFCVPAGLEGAESVMSRKHAGKQNMKKEKTAGYLSDLEMAAFAGQMALVLKAGISGIEGITLMYEDTDDEKDKQLLKQILDEAEKTGYLAPALEKTGAFSPYMVKMTRIGEKTGNLDTVMASLEEYYEEKDELHRNSVNAVFYPLVLTGVLIAVVLVLLVQVMPVFEQVYQELGAEMTGFPLLLKKIGDAIRMYSVSFLLILGALALVAFVSRLTPEGQQFWHRFGRHFRSVRTGYEEEAASAFAGVMAMTLASGLTPEEGLDLSVDLTEEPDFRNKLERVRADLNSGASLAGSLRQQGILSGVYARLASLGEKAGNLDRVFGQIAVFYSQDAKDRLNRRMASVEPTLVIVLSVLIGVILLSVMFPLLGIMSAL
jgi:type IV pilus assembly protein PilC